MICDRQKDAKKDAKTDTISARFFGAESRGPASYQMGPQAAALRCCGRVGRLEAIDKAGDMKAVSPAGPRRLGEAACISKSRVTWR